MKFPENYTSKSTTLHIDALKGGINLSNTQKENKENLADCKNVWFKEGLIKTRPAITTNTDALIYDNQYSRAFYRYFKTPNIEITIDGEPMKMVVEEIYHDDSSYFFLTHFMHWEGSIYKTATMYFGRASDEHFYIPDKIVFFKGKPVNGGGLFALVYLVNVENFEQSDSYIYEIDESFSEWVRITSTYIPTVYINGRGNNYETAEKTGQAFTGTPMRPESLNILNDTFYAYYSSDGCSSSFRLPFANLNRSGITARFYLSVSQYVEWVIAEGETSAKATLNKSSVTMKVNYQKGIISFSKDSVAYELPLISNRNENNLRIMARKSTQYTPKDICNATYSLNMNSKILIAAKNCVFSADYDRPLYFNTESSIAVGEGDNPIMCMAPVGNNVALFEKNKTYLLGISGGRAINSTSLLAENDAVFYKNNKLTVKQISNTVGCGEKESLITDQGIVYWYASNGQIYILSDTGKITEISKNIYSLLEADFNSDLKTVGAKYGESLLFFRGNRALVLQKDENLNPAWYLWEFPESLLFQSVFYGMQSLYFICTNTENELTFIASFYEGKDQFIGGSSFSYELEEKPIQSLIKTKKLPLGCGNLMKKVNYIALYLKAKTAKVSINNIPLAEICQHYDTDKPEIVKLNTGLCGKDGLELEITSDNTIKLGEIDINFTELKFS